MKTAIEIREAYSQELPKSHNGASQLLLRYILITLLAILENAELIANRSSQQP